jgi:hypothetical protein
MTKKSASPRKPSSSNDPDGSSKQKSVEGAYKLILTYLFFAHYDPKTKTTTPFHREEIVGAAAELGVDLPKNKGDVVYSQRFRADMPNKIAAVTPKGHEWRLESVGASRYQFKLLEGSSRILPRTDAVAIKVPDATPEIITANAQGDEQALLAKVRYNRLIDIFLGVTAYSLQNHLRTQVSKVQVEIDEVYVAVNRQGEQFVIPIQAKGGSDQLSILQTRGDLLCCKEKFPDLTCRPVSAQFMPGGVIAMFELASDGDVIKVKEEKHYRLVPSSDISSEDLAKYRIR